MSSNCYNADCPWRSNETSNPYFCACVVCHNRDGGECIYKIEDDLERGNDNDWAREHISEWENREED